MKLSGLHILLTYKCVYECDHCFVWESPRQSGVLAIAQIEQILNQAKDASVDWIYFEDGRRDGLSHWHRLERVLGDTRLITVTGRKTGRKYTTPVGYYQEGDTLWVISSRDRTWWRNATGGAQVDFIRTRTRHHSLRRIHP